MVEIARPMYEKNNEVVLICGTGGGSIPPILVAAQHRHRDMASYLCSVTPFQKLQKRDYKNLLWTTIDNELYDISVEIWEKIRKSIDDSRWKEYFPELAETVLRKLARKPSAFGNYESFFGIVRERLLCLCLKRPKIDRQFVEDLWSEYLRSKEMKNFTFSFIFDAARVGNVEFLIVLISKFPEIVWWVDENDFTIFHIAILHRHERVFNLIFEFGAQKDITARLKDKENNTMLHLAGKLARTDRLNIVSGAALQMQREQLWFKGLVDEIVPPSFISLRNRAGKTAGELFSHEHKSLLESGEKWMKDTANSCMLVATLIATVVFAASFTVPGGNNGETGSPLFFEKKWFTVFIVSDAAALFFSVISILMFLSILTSRYEEKDFLHKLPWKLIVGLVALFLSIVSMVLAFAATFFLLYHSKIRWELILVAVLAFVSVLLYPATNLNLWFEIFLSTFLCRSTIRPGRPRIFK